jgi:integrase
LQTYQRLLRLYVKPAVGRKVLTRLAPRDVTTTMREMADRALAPATINQARKVLGRALRRGMQEELVHRNVAAIVDGPVGRPHERRSLTPEQSRVLLRALQEERLGAAFVVALALGLRRGEVLGLRWDDVDLSGEAPRLRVRQQLQRQVGKGLVLTDLKTPKSRRTLDLPSQVAGILRSHRAGQRTERLRAGSDWADTHGLVFTTPLGKPVDPDNFRHLLARITEGAGLGTWKTHELRYSAGSLLFAMGIPMKVISETLGHSSERVTSDIYVQVMESHRAEAAQAMSKTLWGA